MIVLVTDPITNTMITNPKNHPYLLQGSGRNATKIYFESHSSREMYLRNQKSLAELPDAAIRS